MRDLPLFVKCILIKIDGYESCQSFWQFWNILLGMTGMMPGAGNASYKSSLCKNYKDGKCTYGAKCNFAHGPTELRAPGMIFE